MNTEEKKKIGFVWPYWQAGASFDELRWSIRSVFTHFRPDPGVSIEPIVVGDAPIVRRATGSWYSGRVIPAPRIVKANDFRSRLVDALHKWKTALDDESLPDTLVWMMDDVFFVRPVTLDELRLRRRYGLWRKSRVSSVKTKTGFQKLKKETFEALFSSSALDRAGDFATHLPHVVSRQKAKELFDRFDLSKRPLLWEILYEALEGSGDPVSASPFLRYFGKPERFGAYERAAERSSVVVCGGAGWGEDLRAFLYERLPDRSPVELDEPAPPKGLPARAPEAPVVHKSRPLVTAVLNAFGRPSSFPCQFNAIKRSSVPSELLVWQNFDRATLSQWKKDLFADVIHAGCNHNLGVWARFAFALNARTEYVCVFDDDIIPGARWFENCIETMKRHNGLMGGHGVIFHSEEDYTSRSHFGWRAPNRFAVKVDIVGNAWFFRRDWLGLYWSELPSLDQCWTAGEDFHFSYALQKAGISTFVPQHREGKRFRPLWSCADPKRGRTLGRSGPAICLNPEQARKVRDGLSLYVSKGFRLVEFPKL